MHRVWVQDYTDEDVDYLLIGPTEIKVAGKCQDGCVMHIKQEDNVSILFWIQETEPAIAEVCKHFTHIHTLHALTHTHTLTHTYTYTHVEQTYVEAFNDCVKEYQESHPKSPAMQPAIVNTAVAGSVTADLTMADPQSTQQQQSGTGRVTETGQASGTGQGETVAGQGDVDMGASRRCVPLSKVLTPQVLSSLMEDDEAVQQLAAMLPEGLRDRENVRKALRSSQVMHSIRQLDRAIYSDALPTLFAALHLDPTNIRNDDNSLITDRKSKVCSSNSACSSY